MSKNLQIHIISHIRKFLFLIIILLFSNCSSNLKYLDAYHGLNGNPKEAQMTWYDGEIEKNDSLIAKKAVTSMQYDLKGRYIKSSLYYPDGTPTKGGPTYFSYDKYGNRTKQIKTLIDGSPIIEVHFMFNKHGMEIEKTHVYKQKKTVTKTTYDKKKRKATVTAKKTMALLNIMEYLNMIKNGEESKF